MEVNIEDSMITSKVTDTLLNELQSAYQGLTIHGRSINHINIHNKVKAIQNDGWSCGYWAVRGVLEKFLNDNKLKANDNQDKVLSCKSGTVLRDTMLDILFEFKRNKFKENLNPLKEEAENNFSNLSQREQDGFISRLLSVNNEINKTIRLNLTISDNTINFDHEIDSCKEILDFVKINYQYNIADAILTGRIPANLVNAMTYTGLSEFYEIHGKDTKQMESPISLQEQTGQVDLNSIVLYINQDKNELTLNFPNSKKRTSFSEKVPKSEFEVRSPNTEYSAIDNDSTKTKTLENRADNMALFCPLYNPKGKSSYGINLGDKETVNNFLVNLGLKKTKEEEYKNGQTKYIIYAKDGVPLFKYYAGTMNDTGKTQENTLYIHEDSPLTINNSYLRLSNQGMFFGAVGNEALSQVKEKRGKYTETSFLQSIFNFFSPEKKGQSVKKGPLKNQGAIKETSILQNSITAGIDESNSIFGQLVDDVLKGPIAEFLEDKELYKLAATSKQSLSIFNKNLAKILINAVAKGDQNKAEDIIKLNPDLLLEKLTVNDFSGRTVKGTALQVALGYGDVKYHPDEECMVEMIKKYLIKLPEGNRIIKKQTQEQFPTGWQEQESSKHIQDMYALKKVFDEITNKNGENCDEAIKVFQSYIDNKYQANTFESGRYFSDQLLKEAFRLYAVSRGNNVDPNIYRMQWVKIIGYIERYVPACTAQAICQSINDILDLEEKLERNNFISLGDKKVKFFSEEIFDLLGVKYAIGPVRRGPDSCRPWYISPAGITTSGSAFLNYSEEKEKNLINHISLSQEPSLTSTKKKFNQ